MQGIRQREGQGDERCREERLRQIWRTQGRTFRRVEKLEIPRTVLDVRSNRTQVGNEFKKIPKYAKVKRWLYGVRKAASGGGG